jgi:uncharacterized MAPEG superfamily protein
LDKSVNSYKGGLTFFYLSYIILTVLNKLKMTVTTNERGQQNMFAKEPQMYVSQTDAERYALESHAERAERLNGRAAMLGFVAAIVSYALTGHLFFGVI